MRLTRAGDSYTGRRVRSGWWEAKKVYQNISKDPVCSIHRSKIYRNSNSIIRILHILNRCTSVVLVSSTVTYTIFIYLDVFRDSAITRFSDLLVFAVTRFAGLLVSVIIRFADFLVSAVTRFADLTIFLVSSVNRSIITFARLFVSLILNLPCLPYVSCNLIIIQHELIFWTLK